MIVPLLVLVIVIMIAIIIVVVVVVVIVIVLLLFLFPFLSFFRVVFHSRRGMAARAALSTARPR